MSYEEIDKSVYGTDVFTNGAAGRYSKAKAPTTTTTDEPAEGKLKKSDKKKKAPKVDAVPAEAEAEPVAEPDSAAIEDKPKTKKKSRKAEEPSEVMEAAEIVPPVPEADGEVAPVKHKKKKAPTKDASNTENIDPVFPETTDEPVRKKKSKAPKATPMEGDSEAAIGDLEPTTDAVPKVKKVKKSKRPKTTDPTTENMDDMQAIDPDAMYNTTTADNGLYGENAYGDAAPSQPPETDPENMEPEKSEYESLIIDAFGKLSSKMNFKEFVGEDNWTIVCLPKSARADPKSRIRKMMPGKKDDRTNPKAAANKGNAPKAGFLKRIRTSVTSLVRDENNLIFGEPSNFEMMYPDEEEDGVDTDNLHRYAQKLRDLEDADREVNPEYIVIRDGKTVYGVHEADAEGKMTLSTRKPIYDRSADQSVDPLDTGDKRTLLARLRNPFNRNKDKDGKGGHSPKSATATPDANEKRRSKKSSKKTAADDDIGSLAGKEPVLD